MENIKNFMNIKKRLNGQYEVKGKNFYLKGSMEDIKLYLKEKMGVIL